MTSAIVSRRLKVVTNPDAPITDVGGFFNAKVDLFLSEVVANGTTRKATTEEEVVDETNNTTKTKDEEIEGLENQKQNLKIQKPTPVGGGKYDYFYENGERASDDDRAAYIKLDDEIRAKTVEKGKAEKTTLTQNLDKLDVVPNPSISTPLKLTNASVTNKDEFDKNFVIYCFNDTAFFDKIKNKNFFLKKPKSKQSDKGSFLDKRLSQPLPIKYTFKILGTSGLRRGDMFNIVGIPVKYAKYGLFQITQVEHTIENMNWFTLVKGEYRQIQ
jgi:hypothetical protein